MKQKKLITSQHIAKGLLYHVVFGKPGHWEESELLNEAAVREKRKDSNMKRKKKRRQGANNDMLCEWSGKREKTDHCTVRELKKRYQYNTYHGE